MKKYYYLATAALACIVLNSCNNQNNDPTPDNKDTDKETTENVVNIALSQVQVYDYYEEYGDYQFLMVGQDDKGVAYYASIDILPEKASILGTFSVAEESIDTAYCGFIAGYTEASTKEDIVTPDTISIAIAANGENYNINAEVVYLGVTYKFAITNWKMTDPAYQYEPTEQTTFKETYTEFNGYDYSTDYETVDVELINNETFVALEFYATSALPAGTYKISDSQEIGTVAASTGYNYSDEYDTPSFLGVFTGDGYYNDSYYFVSGQVVVSYPATDTISIQGAVTSYNGSSINFTYEGAYSWEDDSEGEEESAVASVQKLAAKGTKVNKANKHLAIKDFLRK